MLQRVLASRSELRGFRVLASRSELRGFLHLTVSIADLRQHGNEYPAEPQSGVSKAAYVYGGTEPTEREGASIGV